MGINRKIRRNRMRRKQKVERGLVVPFDQAVAMKEIALMSKHFETTTAVGAAPSFFAAMNAWERAQFSYREVACVDPDCVDRPHALWAWSRKTAA